MRQTDSCGQRVEHAPLALGRMRVNLLNKQQQNKKNSQITIEHCMADVQQQRNNQHVATLVHGQH